MILVGLFLPIAAVVGYLLLALFILNPFRPSGNGQATPEQAPRAARSRQDRAVRRSGQIVDGHYSGPMDVDIIVAPLIKARARPDEGPRRPEKRGRCSGSAR